jgi:hypothetical protein
LEQEKLKEEEELIRKGLKVVEGLDQFDNIVVKERERDMERIYGRSFEGLCENLLGIFLFEIL